MLLILYFIHKIVYMTLYDLGGLEIYNPFSPFRQTTTPTFFQNQCTYGFCTYYPWPSFDRAQNPKNPGFLLGFWAQNFFGGLNQKSATDSRCKIRRPRPRR